MIMKNWKYLLILLILISHGESRCQEILNLDDAVKITLENNYAIRIVRKTAEIAKNSNHPGNAGMLPVLNASGSYNGTSNDINMEFASGDKIEQANNRSATSNAGVEMSWTLFNGFGMFYTYRKLEVLENLSDIEAQILIENTLSKLITAWFEAARLQEELIALEGNIRISSERLKRIKDRIEFGAGLKIDALNASVDMNRDSSAYLQKRLAYENVLRNLNFIMGRDANEEFSLAYEKKLPEIMLPVAYHQMANESNSSINQAMSNKQISLLEYKEIKATRYPVIAWNSSWSYSKSEAEAGFFLTNESIGLTTGLSASVSLFDGFRKNIQQQNARLHMEIAEIQYQEIKEEVKMAINNAYSNYEERMKIYKLEEKNIETASQNFIRSNDLYKLGQITSTELREAQLNLLTAKNSMNNAFFQLKLAETELKLISGSLLN